MLLLKYVIQNRRKKPVNVQVDMWDYIVDYNTKLTSAALKQKLKDTDYDYTVGVRPK